MKLVRFGETGAEKPGMLDADGAIRDLSGVVDDIAGDVLTDDGLAKLAAIDPASLPLVEGNPRFGPCVGQVGKFLAIGLNYVDHAAEVGAKLPAEPIVFSKAVTSITGPNDTVEIPRGSEQSDWEVELGFVIGKRAKYVDEADAMDYVAGFCIVNDVSERHFQMHRSGQWLKGKSHDTFGPIGPWLVTKDEVADPHDLKMTCSVNGEIQQDGSTNTMHFKVPQIIAHLTQFMTLMPGDVIATGTPPGVGMGKNPPMFLKDGDVMELTVEGLGHQRQVCRSAE